MKKILLSCVTCLLALGLVTACNNDDEVEDDGNVNAPSDTGTDTGTDDGGSSSSTTETVTLENYVLSISFVDEEGTVTPYEDVDLYLAGDWNSWAFDKCTLGDDGVYTLTIASITTGTHEYKGVTCAETPASDWSNVDEVITEGTGNAKLVVSESDGGGQAITVSPTSSSSSSTLIEEGVHFYVAFIDNSVDTWGTAEPVESLEGDFYFEASAYTGEEGETYTRENNPNIWTGENYCDATQATSTDGHVILYSEEAIAIAEDELWIDVNNGEHWMSQGSTPVEVPEDDTATYVCVIPAWFYGWLDDEEYPSWSGDSANWHTLSEGETITDFVAALTLETATVTA